MFVLGTTVTDIVIAVSLITILLRSRTGLASTDALVFPLVAYTVESGAATAVLALADLVIYHKFPIATYHVPVCFVLSKAYTISFFVVSTV
jgi:hypothetical protein